MNSGKNEIITIYSHVVSQVIFISTSGIAAGVTLLQVGIIQTHYISLTLSFIFFAISLILGVVGLTTLLGQADTGNPDIHTKIVRLPNLISIMSFLCGVIFFTYSLSSHFFSKPDEKNIELNKQSLLKQMETPNFNCLINNLNKEQMLLLTYFIEKSFPNIVCPAVPVDLLKKTETKKKIKCSQSKRYKKKKR